MTWIRLLNPWRHRRIEDAMQMLHKPLAERLLKELRGARSVDGVVIFDRKELVELVNKAWYTFTGEDEPEYKTVAEMMKESEEKV